MIRRLIKDTRASAATEFALSLPMMLALMFVGMEAGHFFWTEHKLVKAVRDGARFAARSQIDSLCNDGT
ncbi:MAG TPA: TadE/TadG family type IV pilus assembly protein, partial [Paracoccaceae bacterium]|nr:TadE/TadG family type IV pilus assembly protein [Paracoccaceae bacterium]